MLDDTLVVWTGEFGRTVDNNYRGGVTSLGRDHNAEAMNMWFVGGGTKAGTIVGGTDEIGAKAGVSYGQSDDWGYKAEEGKTYCYDFHATVLHLLGIDHKRLVYRQSGIDRRLTDVHGHVVKEILT